jgi:hypothetical protein
MFTMSNTLPGTYVKDVQKAPNFVYLTRDQSLSCMYSSTPLLCSENFLQPVWRRQVPNLVASLTSFAGCYFLTYGGRGRRPIQNRSAENDKQVLTVGDGIEQRGSGIPNCFRRHFETRQEIRTRV